MVKIYQTLLTHSQKSLNYSSSVTAKDIEKMLDVVYEEKDLLNEVDEKDDNIDLSEPRDETINTNVVLEIEQVIDLGLWIFIDNSELLTITWRFDDSEDEEDWDPNTIIGN